jgi:hypothetical protein
MESRIDDGNRNAPGTPPGGTVQENAVTFARHGSEFQALDSTRHS